MNNNLKKNKVPYVDNLYRCPANDCDIESKRNILDFLILFHRLLEY